jgi:SAM-dependent methyltransferase
VTFEGSGPPIADKELVDDEVGGAEDVAASVDHVWSNIRVFLSGGDRAAACQLGGDSLGSHLAALADLAVVVGPRVVEGPGWLATIARPDAAPFADRSFDLVVVEDVSRTASPPGVVLAEARRLCRPTGCIVLGSSSVRTARELRQGIDPGAGLVLTALPGPRRPAVLVNPRDDEPARYFVRRVAFAYRSPERGGLVARVEQVRNRVALAAPAKVVLRSVSSRVSVLPGERAHENLVSELVSFVRSSWDALGLPGPAPDELMPLVIGHRRSYAAVVSVLLFGGSQTLVAKLPRYGGRSGSLDRESAAMERVCGSVTGPVRATLPRSLGIHRIGDAEVLLQTAVPGRHLVADTASRRLRRSTLERQLDLMLSWCLRMQAASGRPVVVDEELIASKLTPLAEAGVARLGGDPRVEALLGEALDRARGLVGTSLSLVVAHGDFWAGNVLVDGGRVSGVVDWERSSADDLPIWDPVKAVLDAAYHLDRYRAVPRRGPSGLPRWGELGPWQGTADPRFGVGLRAALVDESWLADLARKVLTSAFTRAGIPLGWLPVAVPFHLVREFVHPDASARSVAGWGSVLRALAAWPGTWADVLAVSVEGEKPGPKGARRVQLVPDPERRPS